MKQKAVNYLYRGFLDSLNIKMRTKALSEINLLKEFGTQLRHPYSKLLKDGIFELRIKFADEILQEYSTFSM